MYYACLHATPDEVKYTSSSPPDKHDQSKCSLKVRIQDAYFFFAAAHEDTYRAKVNKYKKFLMLN